MPKPLLTPPPRLLLRPAPPKVTPAVPSTPRAMPAVPSTPRPQPAVPSQLPKPAKPRSNSPDQRAIRVSLGKCEFTMCRMSKGKSQSLALFSCLFPSHSPLQSAAAFGFMAIMFGRISEPRLTKRLGNAQHTSAAKPAAMAAAYMTLLNAMPNRLCGDTVPLATPC